MLKELVSIVLVIFGVVFSSFVELEVGDLNNLVMLPIIMAIIYFLRTFIFDMIRNKINNKVYI